MKTSSAKKRSKIRLSELHNDAVNRTRRTVVNFDVMIVQYAESDEYSPEELLKQRMEFADNPDTTIDSIWWNWSDGNVAAFPSEIQPQLNLPSFKKWWKEGIDIVDIFDNETRKRGIESFYSHRMNGSDNDPMYVPDIGLILDGVLQNREDSEIFITESDAGDSDQANYSIPMKVANPHWLFDLPWMNNGLWNYAIPEVRDHILSKLREIAENYSFDGIELDFARGFVFPAGTGWKNRSLLTKFIYDVRKMTLEIEEKRGKAFLLATRIPEKIVGCHFDGIDPETWAKDRLVDIFTLGARSFDVDVGDFRKLTENTPIKIYPVLDDHHSCDAYCTPPIEVFRGVFSNWYRQGADGIQTFNWAYQIKEWGPWSAEPWSHMHLQAYKEMGKPESFKYLNKTFVVQRRGGGHGAPVVHDPEDWSPPRHGYANSNMLAQLPKEISNDTKIDAMLTVDIADDLNKESDKINKIRVRILLHDTAEGDYITSPRLSPVPKEKNHQIQRAVIRDWGIPLRPGKENQKFLYNAPAKKGIENIVEIRINNSLISSSRIYEGWLVFEARPEQFALGENLIGIRVTERNQKTNKTILIEKLEVDVDYK